MKIFLPEGKLQKKNIMYGIKMDNVGKGAIFQTVIIMLLLDISNCQKNQCNGCRPDAADLQKDYDQYVLYVKRQEQKVENLYQQLQQTRSSTEKSWLELQKQQENFNQISKQSQNIIFVAAQEIQDIRSNFIKESKKLQQATNNYTKITQKLYNLQEEYERQLQTLLTYEKKLYDVQNLLYVIVRYLWQIQGDEILQYFTPKEQYYIQQREISINTFVQLLDTGIVKNVLVDICSNETEIKITRPTIIQHTKFNNTATKNSNNLELIFQRQNQNLVIKDAEFFRIGLKISGLENSTNQVYLENLDIENAPMHGLHIINCDTCDISNIVVKNSTRNGIQLDNNDCNIKYANIEYVGGYGIVLENGVINSSTIKNSKGYGIVVAPEGEVTGYDVNFSGNLGETSGNFVSL